MATDVSRGFTAHTGFGRDMSFGVTERAYPVAGQGVRGVGSRITRPLKPMNGRTTDLPQRLQLWTVTFAVLNILDLASTFAGLNSGMREGNPLMAALLAHYGFIALIDYKLAVVVLVAFGIHILRGFHAGIAELTISLCNVLVLGVVIMNIIQFLPR